MNSITSGEIFRRAMPLVVVASLGLVGCANSDQESISSNPENTVHSVSPNSVCQSFIVYSQNELPRNGAYGTAIRKEPSIESEQIASIGPKEPISVSGWVEVDEVAYPENPEPWDGGEWFWADELGGWASYPGVRNQPTEHVRDVDGNLVPLPNGEYPTVEDLLKTLVPLDPDCKIN